MPQVWRPRAVRNSRGHSSTSSRSCSSSKCLARWSSSTWALLYSSALVRTAASYSSWSCTSSGRTPWFGVLWWACWLGSGLPCRGQERREAATSVAATRAYPAWSIPSICRGIWALGLFPWPPVLLFQLARLYPPQSRCGKSFSNFSFSSSQGSPLQLSPACLFMSSIWSCLSLCLQRIPSQTKLHFHD